MFLLGNRIKATCTKWLCTKRLSVGFPWPVFNSFFSRDIWKPSVLLQRSVLLHWELFCISYSGFSEGSCPSTRDISATSGGTRVAGKEGLQKLADESWFVAVFTAWSHTVQNLSWTWQLLLTIYYQRIVKGVCGWRIVVSLKITPTLFLNHGSYTIQFSCVWTMI